MLYFDCFSGAAGDMILGAFLDLGLPLDALRGALGSLAIEYGEVAAEKVLRAGITSTKFRLHEKSAAPAVEESHGHHHHHDDHHHHDHHHEHPHHHLKSIEAAIRRSSLSPQSRDRAVALFERLAAAEAAIHGTAIDKVHLHEVGALDSIIDIVGAVYAFEWFGIDDVVSSPLNVGGGMVKCAHGVFPVPAPATALLLRDVPVYGNGTTELVTPTGALVIAGFAREFGPMPPMTMDRIGYGAGDRDSKETPNVLRVMQGTRVAAANTDRVVKLECEIDDMNPQLFAPMMDALFAAGALDVFYTPVIMKKGRPGTLVTVLGAPALRPALTDILFRDSTTIGVRFEEMSRTCLDRSVESVDTPYGAIRFKIARRDGRELNASPEFEDCARAAAEHKVPVKAVQAAAIQARGGGMAPAVGD